MLRTSANDYAYQERMNNLQTVSLTIGYSLPIGKANKQYNYNHIKMVFK